MYSYFFRKSGRPRKDVSIIAKNLLKWILQKINNKGVCIPQF